MHPNRAFRSNTSQDHLDFARHRGFGTLAISTEAAPLLSHLPFLLSDDGTYAELHLVRSNPIARLLKSPRAAKLAVLGPDSYVSPDWYGIDDQVPTWNYVAVHLTGTLAAVPENELSGVLERLTWDFEQRLAPKPPWTMAKVNPEALDKMMKAIIPCRLDIESIDGTWKMNQNKPDEARLRAAEHIGRHGIGSDVANLATEQAR